MQTSKRFPPIPIVTLPRPLEQKTYSQLEWDARNEFFRKQIEDRDRQILGLGSELKLEIMQKLAAEKSLRETIMNANTRIQELESLIPTCLSDYKAAVATGVPGSIFVEVFNERRALLAQLEELRNEINRQRGYIEGLHKQVSEQGRLLSDYEQIIPQETILYRERHGKLPLTRRFK